MIRVLHVERDRAYRDAVAVALEAEGFEVVGTDSGLEALHIAVFHVPDIILCDSAALDMSGVLLLSEIRRRLMHGGERIPFIFLAEKLDIRTETLGSFYEVDAFLPKGSSPAFLLQHIYDAIGVLPMRLIGRGAVDISGQPVYNGYYDM